MSFIGSDDDPVFDLFHAEFPFVWPSEFPMGSGQHQPREKRGPGEFSIFVSPLLANSTPSPRYLLVTSLTSVL